MGCVQRRMGKATSTQRKEKQFLIQIHKKGQQNQCEIYRSMRERETDRERERVYRIKIKNRISNL